MKSILRLTTILILGFLFIPTSSSYAMKCEDNDSTEHIDEMRRSINDWRQRMERFKKEAATRRAEQDAYFKSLLEKSIIELNSKQIET